MVFFQLLVKFDLHFKKSEKDRFRKWLLKSISIPKKAEILSENLTRSDNI